MKPAESWLPASSVQVFSPHSARQEGLGRCQSIYWGTDPPTSCSDPSALHTRSNSQPLGQNKKGSRATPSSVKMDFLWKHSLPLHWPGFYKACLYSSSSSLRQLKTEVESSFKYNLVTLSTAGATASQGVDGLFTGYIFNKVQSNFARRAVVAIAFLG